MASDPGLYANRGCGESIQNAHRERYAHLLTMLQLGIQASLELLSAWQEIKAFRYVRFLCRYILATDGVLFLQMAADDVDPP